MLKYILSRFGAKPVTASGDIASYNRATHRIVPRGASVYDPKVFGKYDLENQKIVAKEEASGNFDLDVIVPLAQRHRSVVDYRLDCDRINLSYQFIPSGSGMLLDACSPIVNERTKQIAEERGYSYQPIDINGDGEAVLKENLCALSLESDSVAVVFSVDTLEHIENVEAALREIYRVLMEHGTAVIHVPAYFFAREDSPSIDVQNDPYGHVRYYSGPDLVKSVFRCGLIPVRIEFNLDYGAAIVCAVKNSDLRQSGDV